MPLPAPAIRVLLIEDDFDVALGLGAYLEARAVTVDYAYTAADATSLLMHKAFDLLIMDVQLPDRDGVSLCRELKANGLRSPVLFLTARGTLRDKLDAFGAGAIDYMVKPFAPAELLARARALVSSIPNAGPPAVRAGAYSLDPLSGVLSRDGKQLPLNRTGLTILRRLMEVSPGAVTRRELCHLLWGAETPGSAMLWMSADRQPPGHQSNADAAGIIAGMAREFAPFADARQQQIHVEQRDTLHWRIPDDVADALIGNLLMNAIQHGLPGRITVLIEADAVAVVNAAGTGARAGFGFGLHIVQRLADRVGWRLDVSRDTGVVVARLMRNVP